MVKACWVAVRIATTTTPDCSVIQAVAAAAATDKDY